MVLSLLLSAKVLFVIVGVNGVIVAVVVEGAVVVLVVKDAVVDVAVNGAGVVVCFFFIRRTAAEISRPAGQQTSGLVHLQTSRPAS